MTQAMLTAPLGAMDVLRGSQSVKDAYDFLELSLNQFIANNSSRYSPSVDRNRAAVVLADLERLVQSTPSQTRRTLEMERFQQFSTPPHMAYVVAWVANIGRGEVVVEPSAGVGGLAVFALNAGAIVHVNELAPRRARLLRSFKFTQVHEENAEQLDNVLPMEIRPSVILMNPPFSAAPTRTDEKEAFVAARHIEQALARLEEGGRLVAIVGGNMAADRPKFASWWGRIGQKYAVRANLQIPGKEYRKYGTTCETQIVVIDKTRPKGKTVCGAVAAVRELLDLLAPIREDRGQSEPSPLVIPPKSDPISVAIEPVIEQISEPLTDELYESYRPLRFLHAHPHPTPLVQSAAMASVRPPQLSYNPCIPTQVIAAGLLSDAQLEAIAYAGQAHQQYLSDGSRKGFFIGDGTGVGKGRELCGIILDDFNKNAGPRKAIWVSKGPKLHQDAVRDWTDLGGSAEQVINLSRFRPNLPLPPVEGSTILFTSYATLKSGLESLDKSRVKQIAAWVGEQFDGVIAFDESHANKNAASIKRERGTSSASETSKASSELQALLPKAKVVYASATGATEVENLAYVDRLGLWGKGTAFASKLDFIAKIKSGGVAAMELVARDMKQLGLYLSRGLSFQGVSYERLEHLLTPEQRDIYNKLTEGWQVVLRNFEKALELVAGYYSASGEQKVDRKAKRAALSAFWSSHQRFFNQVLIAMQMPTVIHDIERHLSAGEACVLQLVNTNEAAQERQLAKLGPDETLDDLDLTPRDQILQLIHHSFPVHQYEPYKDDNGNTRMRLALDSKGDPVINREALRMRERLIDEIASIRVPDGPLEMLLNHFGEQKVAEVTGRSRRVVRTMEGGCERTIVQTRSPSKCLADVEAFQADRKRILIFSDAGGTGASYHADRNCVNQRRRIHYLVQAGWVADAAVQGFGRTHRSNQAQPPLYKLVSTDLKGQKRFISSIARRLDQLGALTKGQRQAGANGIFRESDNLESTYAKDALLRFYYDLDADKAGLSLGEFERQTGLTLRDEEGQLKKELPPITRFLNRLLSMSIGMQDTVFEAYTERLEAVIQKAMDDGTFDVGVETIRADRVKKIAEQVVYVDASGAETKHVELSLSYRNEPRTFEALLEGREATMMKKVEFFARNKLSGHVYAFTDSPDRTEAESGRVVAMYRRLGPIHHDRMPKAEIDARNWEKLDAEQAQVMWEEQVKAVPEFREETLHLITGAVLPIWDRLKGSPKVKRLQTDEGERLLGRVVPEEEIAATLRNLGVDASKYGISLDKLVDQLQAGTHRAELVNGWIVKPVRVGHERRIELVGPSYLNAEALEQDGVYAERIAWVLRFFIPSGKRMREVLKRIVEAKPIAEVVRISA